MLVTWVKEIKMGSSSLSRSIFNTYALLYVEDA